MECSKAAYPNGKLEDFIRWYSLRDWIEHAKTGDGRKKNNVSSKRYRNIHKQKHCISFH